MSTSSTPRRRPARLWPAALFLLCAAMPRAAAEGSERGRLRVSVPARAGTAVHRALLSAKRRLADAECRRVFSDFSAAALGRPLSRELELRGRTPEEQLDAVFFKDGSGKRECGPPTILAFTRAGSDTVYVCASSFSRATASDPTLAEMILIHELLHTLGLGENPPSSREITARVAERCGDFQTALAPTASPCSGGHCPVF
jgi:hypothetical protein